MAPGSVARKPAHSSHDAHGSRVQLGCCARHCWRSSQAHCAHGGCSRECRSARDAPSCCSCASAASSSSGHSGDWASHGGSDRARSSRHHSAGSGSHRHWLGSALADIALHPGVLLHLGQGQPGLGVLAQQPPDEVLSLQRDMRWEAQVHAHNAAVGLLSPVNGGGQRWHGERERGGEERE